ncbi:MAG: hypothetical protein IPJ94_00025 [Chloroflexi bacterium]|nr:hypothetical protein [Chloroflexota bacterium]
MTRLKDLVHTFDDIWGFVNQGPGTKQMAIVIGGTYQNNRGQYEVLDIQGDRLFIEYENGERSVVSLQRQKLILQNMLKDENNTGPKKPHKKSFSINVACVQKFLLAMRHACDIK